MNTRQAKESSQELLIYLESQVSEIERKAEIVKHNPNSDEGKSALDFLDREWSKDARSGWQFAVKKLRQAIKETPSQKAKIEREIENAEQRVKDAIKVTGEIFPGASCQDFVISCNSRQEKITMRTIEENGFEQVSVFRIKSSNIVQWDIIRQLVESDHYPMQLSLPKGRDIANIFRDSKTSPKDDAKRFSRHIINEVRGMYATYSLQRKAVTDKRTVRRS